MYVQYSQDVVHTMCTQYSRHTMCTHHSRHTLCTHHGRHTLCTQHSRHTKRDDHSRHAMCTHYIRHTLCTHQSTHTLCTQHSTHIHLLYCMYILTGTLGTCNVLKLALFMYCIPVPGSTFGQKKSASLKNDPLDTRIQPNNRLYRQMCG